jgi:hypothetical protein
VKNQILIFLHAAKGPLIIYCTGGMEEKLGSLQIFYNLKGGALKKYRETKEGGFEKIYQFEKNSSKF